MLIKKLFIFFPIVLLALHCVSCEYGQTGDDYSERLLIRQLKDGMVYANFEFKTILNQEIENLAFESNFYNLFPLALARFIAKNAIKEINFSLSKGHWRVKQWGYPHRYQANGAELLVAFQHLNLDPKKSLKEVTSVLSGHFCASLNLVDSPVVVQPKFVFRPQGVFLNNTYRQENVFFAALAHESVCTENLTPWKKLLPCFSKAGLASLLNAVHVFNSNYFSLSLDLKSVCRDSSCSQSSIELKQSLSVIFNPPMMFEGKYRWSIIKLFGTSLKQQCQVASSSQILIETTDNKTNPFTLTPSPTSTLTVEKSGRSFAVYDLNALISNNLRMNSTKLNIASISSKEHNYESLVPPPVTASRYITGYGVHQGGIACRIENNSKRILKVIYFDVVPWYLRMFIHTLKVRTEKNVDIKPDKLYYKPGKDRVEPHHLEMIIELPASSAVTILYEFDRAFLKWTEYPPDANHGVYAGSAIITALLPDSSNVTVIPGENSDSDHFIAKIRTESLLVSLPTPDFSMPYNVICLVSTAVSLAFHPIHFLTTKNVRVEVKKEKQSIWQMVKGFFRKS